jgi:hypothetical protein
LCITRSRAMCSPLWIRASLMLLPLSNRIKHFLVCKKRTSFSFPFPFPSPPAQSFTLFLLLSPYLSLSLSLSLSHTHTHTHTHTQTPSLPLSFPIIYFCDTQMRTLHFSGSLQTKPNKEIKT